MNPRQLVQSRLGWLFAERGIRLLLTAPVTFLVARQLGPENFGRLGMALGLGGIAILMTQLGLDRFIRRDLAERPEEAGRIVGTAAVVNLASAIFAATVVSIYAWTGVSDPVARTCVLILAWAGLPQTLAVAEHWFLTVGHPRICTVARLAVLAAGSALRIVGCLRGWPVPVFAGLALLEWVLSGIAVWMLFRRDATAPRQLGLARIAVVHWIRECWPISLMVISGAALERADLFAVQRLSTAAELGYFSGAQRLAELWWSACVLLASAVTPWLAATRVRNQAAYERGLRRYMDLSMGVTLAVAVAVTLVGRQMVALFFGREFAPVGLILIVYCWAAVPVYLEMARSQYLLLERKVHWDVICNLVSLGSSLALYFWLVPRHGALGAAVARLAGLSFAVWLFPWLVPELRPIVREQWAAWLFFRRLGPLLAILRSFGPVPSAGVPPQAPVTSESVVR